MLELNSPKKKLCPKLEKNVNIKPIVFKNLDSFPLLNLFSKFAVY